MMAMGLRMIVVLLCLTWLWSVCMAIGMLILQAQSKLRNWRLRIGRNFNFDVRPNGIRVEL